jgi:hypothetical protein
MIVYDVPHVVSDVSHDCLLTCIKPRHISYINNRDTHDLQSWATIVTILRHASCNYNRETCHLTIVRQLATILRHVSYSCETYVLRCVSHNRETRTHRLSQALIGSRGLTQSRRLSLALTGSHWLSQALTGGFSQAGLLEVFACAWECVGKCECAVCVRLSGCCLLEAGWELLTTLEKGHLTMVVENDRRTHTQTHVRTWIHTEFYSVTT